MHDSAVDDCGMMAQTAATFEIKLCCGPLQHWSMIPKKPAPDLIRGEYRFSEKIMHQQ